MSIISVVIKFTLTLGSLLFVRFIVNFIMSDNEGSLVVSLIIFVACFYLIHSILNALDYYIENDYNHFESARVKSYFRNVFFNNLKFAQYSNYYSVNFYNTLTRVGEPETRLFNANKFVTTIVSSVLYVVSITYLITILDPVLIATAFIICVFNAICEIAKGRINVKWDFRTTPTLRFLNTIHNCFSYKNTFKDIKMYNFDKLLMT